MLMNRLVGKIIAAVPAPFDASGALVRDAQRRYAQEFARGPAGGVAVWAHTGRGLRLTARQRADVLIDWISAYAGQGVVVAAAGADAELTDPARAIASAVAMAGQAAELGADALLVHPPRFARGRPDQDRLIIAYHEAIAAVGLPLILFYLYEEAGGIAYQASVLDDLLSRPEVVGVKMATLDGVMTFQDVARALREHHGGKLLITGEDRFLGYSMMCGARAALIGMGAACVALQASLLDAHLGGDAPRFLELSRKVDELAQATFLAPMEGYIQRMLWCLVHEGILAMDEAHDPWGPRLDRAEFDRIGQVLRGLEER